MAYQTGVVNNLDDIQTAIRLFLVANGWTWSGGGSPVLHKDQMFVKFITPTVDTVRFVGTTALSGGSDTPRQVGMGRMVYTGTGNVPALITFPATYRAFLNDDEFYFILNYDTTRYQFVTWGKSTLDVGAGATGMFLAGTINNLMRQPGNTNLGALINIAAGSGGIVGFSNHARSAAPFWDTSQGASDTYGSSFADLSSSFVHSDLGSVTWRLGVQPLNDATRWDHVGNGYAGNLQSVLPNTWNGESPFLPLRAYRLVDESKVSLVLDLQHARQCRIDNFADNEIVTVGTDEWQVFPFHRRNVAARNGGTFIDHTGTFGWAIRKVL